MKLATTFLLILFTLTTSSAKGEEGKKKNTLNFIMNTPDEKLKEFYSKFREKTSILEFLQGLAIETYPKVVPVAPVVEVNLHHSFITTVYFPEGSKLIKAVSLSFGRLFRNSRRHFPPQSPFWAVSPIRCPYKQSAWE